MNVQMTYTAMISAVIMAFVIGCGGERGREKSSPSPLAPSPAVTNSAEAKVAALEKDVAKLRTEVRQLRQRVEMAEKMRLRHGMPPVQHRPGMLEPEDVRNAEFRARQSARQNGPDAAKRGVPPAGWQDPATMTPEQRRAWHEERRKLREERHRKVLEEHRREKVSEPGKQTTTNTKKENQ